VREWCVRVEFTLSFGVARVRGEMKKTSFLRAFACPILKIKKSVLDFGLCGAGLVHSPPWRWHWPRVAGFFSAAPAARRTRAALPPKTSLLLDCNPRTKVSLLPSANRLVQHKHTRNSASRHARQRSNTVSSPPHERVVLVRTMYREQTSSRRCQSTRRSLSPRG
jgi:hypothetical protein